MLGKLTLAAIPYQNPIIFGAIVFMVLVAVAPRSVNGSTFGRSG
jgi:hypothetical protein